MNGLIETYWVRYEGALDVYEQFSESTVLALFHMGVLDFVETERREADSLTILAHRYRKAD